MGRFFTSLLCLFLLPRLLLAEGLVSYFNSAIGTELCSAPVATGFQSAHDFCSSQLQSGQTICAIVPHPNNPNARNCRVSAPGSTCEDGFQTLSLGTPDTIQCFEACSADVDIQGPFSGATNSACYGTCEYQQSGMAVGLGSNPVDFFGDLTSTGQGCDIPIIDAELPDETNCVSTDDGLACATAQEPGCGTVNGESFCADQFPPDNCVSMATGGTLCAGDLADTPPLPDSGVPGTPAVPDATFDNEQDVTVANYYSSTTINNSTVGNGGATSNSGGGGGGSGGGGTPGGGAIPGGGPTGNNSGNAGGTCTGEDCGVGTDFDYEGAGADDWYEPTDKTFGTVIQNFGNEMAASPIGQAADGFFDVSIGGSCPVWSANIPVFGDITFDAQCSAAMQSIFPIVSAVLLLLAGFVAFRWALL